MEEVTEGEEQMCLSTAIYQLRKVLIPLPSPNIVRVFSFFMFWFLQQPNIDRFPMHWSLLLGFMQFPPLELLPILAIFACPSTGTC